MSFKTSLDTDWKLFSEIPWNKSSKSSSKSDPKSRPKSLETGALYSFRAAKENGMFSCHSDDLSDNPMTWVFLGFKRSKKIRHKKQPKSKKVPRRTNGLVMRPLTWGPNGSKFMECLEMFSDSKGILNVDIKQSNSLIKSPKILDDLANNNVNMGCIVNVESPDSEPKLENGKNIKAKVFEKVEDKNDSASMCFQNPPRHSDLTNTSSTNSNLLCVNSTLIDMKRFSTEFTDEELVAQDVLVEIVNEVTRKEALDRSESVFKENEQKLMRKLSTKLKEDEEIQRILFETIDKIDGKEPPNAKINLEKTDYLTDYSSEVSVVLEYLIETACKSDTDFQSEEQAGQSNVEDQTIPTKYENQAHNVIQTDTTYVDCNTAANCSLDTFTKHSTAEAFANSLIRHIFNNDCSFNSNASSLCERRDSFISSSDISLAEEETHSLSCPSCFDADAESGEALSESEVEFSTTFNTNKLSTVTNNDYFQPQTDWDSGNVDVFTPNTLKPVLLMADDSCGIKSYVTEFYRTDEHTTISMLKSNETDHNEKVNEHESNPATVPICSDRQSISELFDVTFTYEFHLSSSLDSFNDVDGITSNNNPPEQLSNESEVFSCGTNETNHKAFQENLVNICKGSDSGRVPLESISSQTKETGLSCIVVNDPLQAVTENKSSSEGTSNSICSSEITKSMPQSSQVIKQRVVKCNSLVQLYEKASAVVVNKNRVHLKATRPRAATDGMLNNAAWKAKRDYKPTDVPEKSKKFHSQLHSNDFGKNNNKSAFKRDLTKKKSRVETTEKSAPTTNENLVPERPTSLFGTKGSSCSRNSKAFDFLKDLSSSDLTPAVENSRFADIFSETTERVLEENKSIRRQESFTKRKPPIKYRQRKNLNNVLESRDLDKSENSDISNDDDSAISTDSSFLSNAVEHNFPSTDFSCQCYEQSTVNMGNSYKSRSLPLSMKTDYHSFNKLSFMAGYPILEEPCKCDPKNATPTASFFPIDLLRVEDDRRRRDSALSRESAASSGTVVASDDDNCDLAQENKDTVALLKSSPIKISKSSSSADAVFCSTDVTDSVPHKRPHNMERSHSLDRQAHFNMRRLHYSKSSSPPFLHQSNCSMMLSAPTITVTHDCSGGYRQNDVSNPMFDPIMSSSQSLASSSSYMGDESDVIGSSSRGSSAPPSPTESPRLLRISKAKFKSKALRDRNNKFTERQATDALEWLKAAGFPQYAQLYEVGSFPVDIASVSSDHDFLAQEHIAALVRRLNVLNRCASLKLDKTPLREPLTDDNEEDDYEQCALSEFWHLEDDGHRWSRMDSKASSVGSPSSRLPSSVGITREEIRENSNANVFANGGHARTLNEENSSSDGKVHSDLPRNQRSLHGSDESNNSSSNKAAKVKGTSFLKRVGEFKKLGSFRKKDLFQRHHSIDGDADAEAIRSSKPRSDSRVKSWRKTRKVVIGEPVLQTGHERFDQMRCVPIDGSAYGVKELQNQHMGRKNSSHSLISSSSSSGGASAVSTPASRTRTSTDDFLSDMGEISPGIHGRNRTILEMNIAGGNTALRSKEPQLDRDNSFYVIPSGYKPGTFPSALREKTEQEETPSTFSYPSGYSSRSNSDSNQTAPEAPKKLSRPMSIYDNLPDTALNGNASAQDIINIMDPGSPLGGVEDSGVYEGSMESLEPVVPGLDTAFWSVDEIVERTQCLQQIVGAWDEEESADDRVDSIESNQAECQFPSTLDVLPSYSSENISTTEDDTEANTLPHSHHRLHCRRRWDFSNKDTRNHLKPCEECLQLHTLSVGQLMILKRLSMLKLTALMESYAFSNSKGTLSWSVPRFIRKMKVPDYKDKSVFGVPLLQNVQRSGHPLPPCIQHALAYLRRNAMDHVGLFRKPGVRSRIQNLRGICENNPDRMNFDDCSAYDVADMVKQYFRELPDPLMTMKMSETFVGIFLYVPEDVRLQTLQAAIMLLPDESRETLKTLLYFLSEIASKSDENQMNASNLSTCFSPSLFYQQFNTASLLGSATSQRIRKSQGSKMAALGKPDMREMSENRAANHCLAFMIRHVNEVFKISEDAMTQCRMSVMQQTEDVLATHIGYTSDDIDVADYYADFHAYVDRVVAQTMREEQRISQNKGGWQNVPCTTGSELMFKKMNDGNPLRLWRSQVEITGADPNQIMDRVLNERHLWDEDLLQWKVLQKPDERTRLFQIVLAEMSPHPSRDYCVMRSWRTDVNSRGSIVVVETSTGQQALLGDIRGVVLTSRYIIEPTDTPNKCTLTHVCRVDTKGRNPEWYNKAYGHIVTQRLSKIRNSIRAIPPKASSTCS